MHTYTFVWHTERCSASEIGCEAVWNIDVRDVHRELVAGTLDTDHLQSLCRYVCLHIIF